MIAIRDYGEKDFEDVLRIACALPEWFSPTGVEHMRIDARFTKGLVAVSAGEIVGFLFYSSDEGVVSILWIAVVRESHRKGIGRALVCELAERAAQYGVHEMRVDTLGDSVEYEPYSQTRAFYRAQGFSDFKRVMQDDPECPELLTLSKRIS